MKNMKEFTNLYQLSKTLRFELIPQGKTLENIQENGLLSQDVQRAEHYKKVKKIIDEYHKSFIKKSLGQYKINPELLENYFYYYKLNRDDNQKKKFEEVQAKMRKDISECFTKNEQFIRVFGKELIREDLDEFIEREEEKALVREFKNFTTYFTGFNENRKNMYSAEDKSTAIACRLVHDNLPKFIDNMRVFEILMTTELSKKTKILYEQMQAYLNVLQIDDIFKLHSYSDFLTQEQIDVYNAIIGGKSEEKGKKIQGLNEYINLYNQQQKDKSQRIPKFKPLYKQILSDRNAISWLPDEFEKGQDNMVLESIEKCYQDFCQTVFDPKDKQSLIELLMHIREYDVRKIYLSNDASLTNISQQLFGSWAVLQKALELKFESENPRKKGETEEKFVERRSKFLKQHDGFSIGYLNECLALMGDIEKEGKKCTKDIADYFLMLGKREGSENLFIQMETKYNEVKELLNAPYPEEKNLSQDKAAVEKIKNFLDSIKEVQWFIKPLTGKNESDKDERFYGEFTAFREELDKINPLYNKVRNYMTQKPYSEEKIKLNFENSHFLRGWIQDYETKAGLIFFKDGLYYLGINNKKLSDSEKLILKSNEKGNNIGKRIILDFQKSDNKNIPRIFIRSKGNNFAPSVSEYNLPIHDIIKIYDEGKFKTEYRKVNELDYLKSLHKLIDYFKLGFQKHKSFNHYNFIWKETKEYKDISEFYNDVEVSCYQIIEENVNWERLLEFVNSGKIYLFQIYNKDFSPYSKGTPNMHTVYWKMLFSPENLQNVVYKLNGQAEVFYRKASIKEENKIVHKANQVIENKNKDNDKRTSVFEYDLVKDYRYTVDKFHFHVPITMNFKAEGIENINPNANEYIKENAEKMHVIGIDRGERHLLYLSLIDGNGKIIKQFSLNKIVNEYKGKDHRTDYHFLLNKREEDRKKERESWKTIETIKELKEGYISQVVHLISELMIEYNAIVVLEDLNQGFMRGRQKVEKQVYQKFEKMLIDKLNYLVDKKKQVKEPAGALNALQLTNKFISFQKMGNQSGFLFYVPAWNTSKMCPTTGFVNLFDTRYENVEKTKAFFEKFKSIRYNAEKEYFEFEVDDYSRFSGKAEGTRLQWTICSHGTRIENYRNPQKNNEWDSRELDITAELKQLLGKTDGDLKAMILSKSEKVFFERLMHLFKLTVQMRNSEINSEKDYMISPVADSKGAFYDSRDYEKIEEAPLPTNADANGAYNIARKGLWVIEQIKNTNDFKTMKLAISNKEWLQYAQNKNN